MRKKLMSVLRQSVALLIVASQVICPLAYASDAVLDITVEELLSGMSELLAPYSTIGMPCYPLEITEKDLTSNTVLKLLTRHTSISIKQQEGIVKSFKIVSDEDKGDDSENRTQEIMITCVCAMLLTNDAFNEDNAVSILTGIVSDKQSHVYGNVSYRFVTGNPFTTVVALEVTPAE